MCAAWLRTASFSSTCHDKNFMTLAEKCECSAGKPAGLQTDPTVSFNSPESDLQITTHTSNTQWSPLVSLMYSIATIAQLTYNSIQFYCFSSFLLLLSLYCPLCFMFKQISLIQVCLILCQVFTCLQCRNRLMKGEDKPPVLTSMCLVQRTVSSGVQAGSQSTQPLLASS